MEFMSCKSEISHHLFSSIRKRITHPSTQNTYCSLVATIQHEISHITNQCVLIPVDLTITYRLSRITKYLRSIYKNNEVFTKYLHVGTEGYC